MSLLNKASLIQIPSGYKDGTLYSAKPTNGDGDFTFSRGSNLAATRVNSEGLIEKGRENLLLQSNSFDTTWVTSSASVNGGQTGYDGSNDAWLLSKSASNGFIRQFLSPNGVYTFSLYAKAGTLNWVRLFMAGSVSATSYFDLQNGVVGTTSGSPIDTKIEDIENGWYRISITHNDSTYGNFRIYPADDDNDTSGTSGNIYIQDAQLEQGLVATDYIETTTTTAQAGILEDMPRLDYSGGSCPALLLEPQRSNVITQSEYIGAWTESALTITDNNATSPEGVLNAAKLTLPSGSATKRIALGSMPVTAVARSYSFFVKSDDITAVQLVHSGDLQGYARFDISTGVVGSTGTKTTSDIQDYGNGWYRCIANFDSSNAFGSTIYLYISDSATGSYGGSTSAEGDLFVYGAQYEEGSYPTSYIPTYGSSVTRSSDALETSPYDYQSQGVLGANVGTIILDCETIGTSTGSNDFHMFGEAKSIADGYLFRANTGTTIDILERDSNSTSAQWTGIAVKQTRNKIAVSYSGSDVDVYANGVAKSLSSGTPVGGGNINGFANSTSNSAGLIIHQILLFPNKLTNDELADLTTL